MHITKGCCLPYINRRQECIPVGCIPAARRPYAGVCFPGGLPGLGSLPGLGGVCLVWGVGVPGLGGSAWSGGGLPGLEGCLVGGGGAWSGGGGAWSGGSGIPAYTEADTLPPVDRHTPVKTLPWPQLRCGQ